MNPNPEVQSRKVVPVRRFAVLVITEAADGASAAKFVRAHLHSEQQLVWLGNAGPIGPATHYELIEVRLLEDGDPVVTGPEALSSGDLRLG